jgi:MFS family permease
VHQVETRVRRPTALIPWGVLVTGLSYLVLNAGGWPGLALLSTLLVTVGEMLTMPFMMGWAMNRATDQNRGQYMGLYSMAYSLSQVMSPVVGAQTVMLAGFRGLWYVIFSISVISATGFWWLGVRLARPEAKPSVVLAD